MRLDLARIADQTMTQDEARPLILAAWRAWLKNQELEGEPTGTDAFIFFGQLQQSMPHLLSFRNSGDKWQCVHSWLLSTGAVKT